MEPELRAQRIVALVGPTASGKSDLAMDLALRLGGEIVSCDSVQVYRGLDIGSGKPSPADRARVPHHLIDILDIEEEMNAALFASLASAAIAEIAGRGRLPIITGGTGLYLTALLKGLFEQGASDPSVRRRLEALAERHGSARLHRLLAAKDPDYAKRTQPGDRVRIVRALEVCLAQGRPFTQAQQERRPAYSGEALIVGLHPGRQELRARVTARVAGMIGRGLIEETRKALERTPKGGPMPRPLGAIGYREAVASIASGRSSASGDGELQRAIVTSTMQYAKRQMTYFRRQFDVEWFAESAAAADRVAGWVARQDMGNQE